MSTMSLLLDTQFLCACCRVVNFICFHSSCTSIRLSRFVFIHCTRSNVKIGNMYVFFLFILEVSVCFNHASYRIASCVFTFLWSNFVVCLTPRYYFFTVYVTLFTILLITVSISSTYVHFTFCVSYIFRYRIPCRYLQLLFRNLKK